MDDSITKWGCIGNHSSYYPLLLEACMARTALHKRRILHQKANWEPLEACMASIQSDSIDFLGLLTQPHKRRPFTHAVRNIWQCLLTTKSSKPLAWKLLPCLARLLLRSCSALKGPSGHGRGMAAPDWGTVLRSLQTKDTFTHSFPLFSNICQAILITKSSLRHTSEHSFSGAARR